MKAGLILPQAADPWLLDTLREGFAAIARALTHAGWNAELIEASALATPRIPLIAGAEAASATQNLRDGHAIAAALRKEPFDLLFAPLGGGIAQPLLMSRATGEAFQDTTVLLWCDTPAAWRARHEPAAPGLAALVEDAQERTCLRLADGLVAPGQAALDRTMAVAAAPLPARLATFPPLPGTPAPSAFLAPGAIREIAFVGPATAASGLPAFLDAVEELGRAGRLGQRCVSFIGPMRESALGLGKTLLGIRAQRWNFDFRVEDAPTPSAAAPRLRIPGLLPVFGPGEESAVLRASLAHAGIPALLATEPAAFPSLLDRALSEGAVPEASPPQAEWPALLHGLIPSRPGHPPPTTPPLATVCIVHQDRPHCLARALASIDDTAEVLVVDNASTAAASTTLLRDLESAGTLRLIRLSRAVSQAAACNRTAAEATGEVVIFLDDDNIFTPGGLSRFRRALAGGAFDIVVTCLDLHDGDPARSRAAARMLFLGDAGSAGLFFNGFGDTGFAIRRADFLRLGGFDAAEPGPALDWVFLARARAAGLRIGVIQEPAIRYAREIGDHDRKWRKRDQEGARSAVLRAYGNAFDPVLVARLAQGLLLQAF